MTGQPDSDSPSPPVGGYKNCGNRISTAARGRTLRPTALVRPGAVLFLQAAHPAGVARRGITSALLLAVAGPMAGRGRRGALVRRVWQRDLWRRPGLARRARRGPSGTLLGLRAGVPGEFLKEGRGLHRGLPDRGGGGLLRGISTRVIPARVISSRVVPQPCVPQRRVLQPGLLQPGLPQPGL